MKQGWSMARVQTVARLVGLGGALGLVALLFAQFVREPLPAEPEKINLALRRTAHHLLQAAGDTTSRIPSVEQPDTRTYRLRLARGFDYDQLPGMLKASLALHHVTTPYDVAVLDCATQTLQLGYTIADLTGQTSVPCGGRSMNDGCYVLQVRFAAPERPKTGWAWALAVGALGTGLALLIWPGRTAQRRTSSLPQPDNDTPDALGQLRFGQSVLDMKHLTLITGPHECTLTYREAKLLRLFVQQPNVVLDRDTILKQVWEDEGVTVGRSVDVFVSRLRKRLQPDATVQLVAVHGVGYRLNVANEVSAKRGPAGS